MLFHSLEFVFLCLPAALLAFIGIRTNRVVAAGYLLFVSAIFYVLASGLHLFLIAALLGINFGIGRVVQAGRSRPLLAAGLALNLGVLGYFNWTGTTTLAGVIGLPLGQAVLPVGLAFFAIRQTGYLLDCARQDTPKHSFLDYALFAMFFPAIVAGPIARAGEITPQFSAIPARPLLSDISVGLTIFVIGLSKKVILADSLAPAADLVFGDAAAPPHFLLAWIGVVAYGLQIYFSFSGYADMAIGLARVFGVTLPANFASPYRAKSITEFWERWHITLWRFLRDNVYRPLGGEQRGAAPQCLNFLIMATLCGLWHGAAVTFVAWGLLHGAALSVHTLWQRLQPLRLPTGIAQAITLLTILALWVPFRAPDLATAAWVWAGMAGLNGFILPATATKLLGAFVPAAIELKSGALGIDPLIGALWLPLGLLIALFGPNTQTLLRHHEPVIVNSQDCDGIVEKSLEWRPSIGFAIATGLLLILCLMKLNDAAGFSF